MVTLESKAVRRIALALTLCLGGGVFAAQLTGYAQKGRVVTTEDKPVPANRGEGRDTSATSNDAAPVLNGTRQDGKDVKTNAFTDDGFWTTTGATGQIDESSVGLADFRNFEVGFRTTPAFPAATTGTIVVRYNITAVIDAIRPGLNGAQNVKVRYRDQDGTGAGSQVLVTLFRVAVDQPLRQQIAQFDSNQFGTAASGAGNFQSRSFTFCPSSAQGDFDFTNYAYYAEVQLSRNSTALQANFGALQIAESDSNPCPTVVN